MIHLYGGVPVPYPVMWSAEEEYFVGKCPVYGETAICQLERQGEGVPQFGRPHAIRQRRAMKLLLCDLCEQRLRNATKISLSNFGADYSSEYMLSQVEPLLHAECAKISIQRCPALKRQLANGQMRARRVFRCRPRATLASAKECSSFVPDYNGPPILGLSVMDLLSWRAVTLSEQWN